jgi:tryptophanyl-tRNA synthetase
MRIFSGIQPTGVPQLGNYLGALKHWAKLQKNDVLEITSGVRKHIDVEPLYCIVDLHALTICPEPKSLEDSILNTVALFLACGLDTQRCTIFQQSTVLQHGLLAWILGTLTPMGLLNRMTQWKVNPNR